MKLPVSLLFVLVLAGTLRAQPKETGWLREYASGLAEAKRTGKPLFVVFRCDPCDDTAEFDQQVLRLDPELANRFVRVRSTRITGVDLNLFDFDYDCTWFGVFLDANEKILGRFGGRDGISPTTYLSIPALKSAMTKILDRPPRKEETPEKREAARMVEDYPAAKKLRGNACIHCHEAKIFEWEVMKQKNLWSRENFYVYPLPEKIGIKLRRDRSDTVEAVLPQSPADQLGIKPGDRIDRLDQMPIASFADVTYALHRSPRIGEVAIEWVHQGKTETGKLVLAEGWRKGDLSWRPSMFEYIPKLQLSGYDLDDEEKKSLGLTQKQFAMRHDKLVHSTLKTIGVKENDILLGLDRQPFEGTMKQLQAFVKKNYLAGDKITLNLLREGKKVDLELVLK